MPLIRMSERVSDIEVLHQDHPKVYARWIVIIGGGKSPTKWAKKLPTTRKTTAKLFSHSKRSEAGSNLHLPVVRE